MRTALSFIALATLTSAILAGAQTQPVELQQQVSLPFRFVAYGDTRFTDPKNTDASNPEIRKTLVRAIADAKPAFISIGGDLVYRGYDPNDWSIWDAETTVWRDQHIPVYPAIGNHELQGDEKVGLGNYFRRFPDLKNNRYYSVRAANTLLLALDSALDETTGPQGTWLKEKLDTLPPDVDFVLVVMHHPPFTSSTDRMFGGGHSARSPERMLAAMLEERQRKMRARIVVFAGHVHNYERHEHAGITYFVTGGGGAHPYLVERRSTDLFQGKGVFYHYLLVEVDRNQMTVTMNRLELKDGKEVWTQPDVAKFIVPAIVKAAGTK